MPSPNTRVRPASQSVKRSGPHGERRHLGKLRPGHPVPVPKCSKGRPCRPLPHETEVENHGWQPLCGRKVPPRGPNRGAHRRSWEVAVQPGTRGQLAALFHAASQLCSPARPGKGNRIVPGAGRRCVAAPSSLRGAWNLNSCPERTWVAWDRKPGVPQGAAGPQAPHVATHTRATRAVPGTRAVGRPPKVPSESSSSRNQATSPSWPDLRHAEADARQDRVARGRPEPAAGWRSLQPGPGSRRQRVKRPLPPAGMARRQRGARTAAPGEPA